MREMIVCLRTSTGTLRLHSSPASEGRLGVVARQAVPSAAVFDKLLYRLSQVLPRAGASPAMPVERESSPAVPFCHGCRRSAAAVPRGVSVCRVGHLRSGQWMGGPVDPGPMPHTWPPFSTALQARERARSQRVLAVFAFCRQVAWMSPGPLCKRRLVALDPSPGERHSDTSELRNLRVRIDPSQGLGPHAMQLLAARDIEAAKGCDQGL